MTVETKGFNQAATRFVISGDEFWFGSVTAHQNVRGLTTQTTPGINYLAFVIAATIESYAELVRCFAQILLGDRSTNFAARSF